MTGADQRLARAVRRSPFHQPPFVGAVFREVVPSSTADEGYRLDLGRRAGAYVRTRWGSAQVAERYLRIVNRDIPPEWMVDPSACRYLQGWGMPDDLRRRAIGAIVRQAGLGYCA